MTTSGSAYPWRDATRSFDEGETAPGGPDMTSRLADMSGSVRMSHRTDAEIKEEYSKLKDAGMPLESMKLVLNEDLSAVRCGCGAQLLLRDR